MYNIIVADLVIFLMSNGERYVRKAYNYNR